MFSAWVWRPRNVLFTAHTMVNWLRLQLIDVHVEPSVILLLFFPLYLGLVSAGKLGRSRF